MKKRKTRMTLNYDVYSKSSTLSVQCYTDLA